jgi:radical SAM protein with 4Fe4S-binding SPASM domain
VQPLSYEDVVQVIEQYRHLRNTYNAKKGIQRRGHINITGGEPFIRADVPKILTHLGSYKDQLSYGVLSNGSFLDAEKLSLLKQTGAAFVQLSIDGDRATHDALRAPGDYDRTFQAARLLERHGIPAYISFTANRKNYIHLPKVAAACRRHGITKLWTDRLVPIGNGAQLEDLSITKDLLPGYLKALKKAQGNRLTRLLFPKTRVTADRALQFLGAAGAIYSCSAGNSLITVDEFGTVMPCRRMPIPCGTVFETTLTSVYYDNEVFRKLRGKDIPKECAHCKYAYHCRGGARCQSYAVCGSFYRADPACPLLWKDDNQSK